MSDPVSPVVTAPAFTITPQHADFFAWVENTTPAHRAAILEAVAGSGKTSTLIQAARRIPTTQKGIYVAFNKRVVDEIKGRLPAHITASTLHSVGYRAVMAHFGKAVDPRADTKKTWKLFDEFTAKNPRLRDYSSTVTKMVAKAKAIGLVPDNAVGATGLVEDTPDVWREDVIERFHIDMPNNENSDKVIGAAVDIAREVLRMGLVFDADHRAVDFDDQLYLCVAYRLPLTRYKWLLVDEAQDISPVQRRMIHGMIAMKTGRIIAVGDKNQCHPAGTLVEVAGGAKVPIEQVSVGDKVVSYHDCFRGLATQGRPVEAVSSHRYKGDMLKVIVGGKSVSMTPNHRVPTRLDDVEGYAVYVMESGHTSRIGHCQLVYTHGFGPAMRVRHERADRCWVVATFAVKEDAMVYETELSLRFNIPENIFTEKGRMRDRIMAVIGDNRERARACLEAHGRLYEYPLVGGTADHIGKYLYVTEACNLLPGYNTLRTFDGTRDGGSWEHIAVERTPFDGLVYGITVAPTEGGHRLYVADQILVHNSIYGFRGADSSSLDSIASEFDAQSFPLTVTYRCPTSVVKLARAYVPHLEAVEGAPEGRVTSEPLATIDWRSSDLVVCRNNAPLITLAYQLLRKRVACKVLGRDIGAGVKGLVKKLRPKSLPDLLERAAKYELEQTLKLRAADKQAQVEALVDRVETLRAFAVEARDLTDLENSIDSMFAEDVVDMVVLSTIHKAKGAEAPRVVVLDPRRMPARGARAEWEIQQERNLCYVAYTRARETLVFASLDGSPAFAPTPF